MGGRLDKRRHEHIVHLGVARKFALGSCAGCGNEGADVRNPEPQVSSRTLSIPVRPKAAYLGKDSPKKSRKKNVMARVDGALGLLLHEPRIRDKTRLALSVLLQQTVRDAKDGETSKLAF